LIVVVTWLRRRAQTSSAWASDAWTRSRSPSRTSAGVEKPRSRVQNMSKWPGLAVKVRPFQHASMQARTMAAASPGWRV
jgi:hypothetical protein